MKRTIRLTALVALVAGLALASCQKEDNNSNTASNGGNTPVGWVDLGLPSGLLWAECNLGATSPEEYGNYYAWGETQPKEVYDWSTYRYCTVNDQGNLQTLIKYNTTSTYGTPDSLTTLEAVDDAATAAFGSGARMPTADEWRELIDNTTVEWTTLNGVNGRKFTAANGNALFLPAAGRCEYTNHCFVGSMGFYWSSSLELDTGYQKNALSFCFYSDHQHMLSRSRFEGFYVRAVRQN